MLYMHLKKILLTFVEKARTGIKSMILQVPSQQCMAHG